MDESEIRETFQHRILSGLKLVMIEKIRSQFVKLALCVNEVIPDSPEKSLGMRSLEVAMHWFITAVKKQNIENDKKIGV